MAGTTSPTSPRSENEWVGAERRGTIRKVRPFTGNYDSKPRINADKRKDQPMTQLEKATFGAGCFWGVEVAFRQVRGVTDATAGYLGGTLANPTYEDVC